MNYTLNKHLLSFILILSITEGFPGDVKTPKPQNTIRFTENKNQWDKKVLYRAELDGGAMFLERNCFTYNFYDKEKVMESHTSKGEGASRKLSPIRSHAFRMTILNSTDSIRTIASQASPDICNFFIGKDKNKWAGNVNNYKEVDYKNIYNHIDLQLLGYENSIKYNFIVAPQGNTDDIKLFYQGLQEIKLDKGTLKLTTSLNELIDQHPFAYQWIESKRIEVKCEFVLENTTIRFNFPNGYDKSYELVIDPVLVFAATSGSVASNFGHTATYDAQGNLYAGGIAFGQGYPITIGASYDTTFNGGDEDVVISKYDASGAFLHYSTYLGGTGDEIVTSLIVDAQNNLHLSGVTGSSDFPVTSNAYDTTFNGGTPNYYPNIHNGNYYPNGTDIFVAEFNATGTFLIASTYIGGSGNDGVNSNNIDTVLVGYNGATPVYTCDLDSLQYNYGDYYRGEIDLDKSGNVVVITSSRSTNFPIVKGFGNTLGGQQDAVVFKLNSNLSQLLWSTYIGGSDNDAGYSIALDSSANVYVTGGTRSSNFPTTAGTLQTTYNGGAADGFVAKIKNDGSVMLYSTLWGTPAYDQTYFVQLDKNNNVYVFGQTEGTMPITAGVYNNPNSGQFITEMNNSLNSILFSTVFGNGSGIPVISPTAFLVDNCGNIYVSGWANGFDRTENPTTGMPVTANAYQSTTSGQDFYLLALNTNASSLLYATYFGGNESWEHCHGGTSRYDKKGIVYQSLCTGCGGYNDFPGTPGAWPNTAPIWNGAYASGGCNNGVFKLDFQVPLADGTFTVNQLNGCAPLTVTFNYQNSPGSSFLWNFGSGDTTSTIENPIKTFSTPGTYKIQLIANNPASCNLADTTYQYITVYPAVSADFDFTVVHCTNEVMFSDSSKGNPISWLWYFGDGDSSTVQNPSHTYDTTGNYPVQLIASNSNGCKDTTIVDLDFRSVPASISKATTICKNNNIQLQATGGIAYHWSPAGSLSDPSISNPIANPDTTTTYTVAVFWVNIPGDTCIKIMSTKVTVLDPALYTISARADKDTLFQGQSTIIHAITDSILTVSWIASTGVYVPPYFNTTVTPQSTTTYTVSILDTAGCPKSATITIFVIQCNPAGIFVPNAFTPNGDGVNDILYVKGNSISELYFAVYNRWGQMVFQTNDMTIGWNGIYNNMKSDPAVFAWYLRAKCYTGELIEKQGNVTLLR